MTPDQQEHIEMLRAHYKEKITMREEQNCQYELAITRCEQAQRQAKLICYVLLAIALMGAVVIHRLW